MVLYSEITAVAIATLQSLDCSAIHYHVDGPWECTDHSHNGRYWFVSHCHDMFEESNLVHTQTMHAINLPVILTWQVVTTFDSQRAFVHAVRMSAGEGAALGKCVC